MKVNRGTVILRGSTGKLNGCRKDAQRVFKGDQKNITKILKGNPRKETVESPHAPLKSLENSIRITLLIPLRQEYAMN